jgi:hypothetical protein
MGISLPFLRILPIDVNGQQLTLETVECSDAAIGRLHNSLWDAGEGIARHDVFA